MKSGGFQSIANLTRMKYTSKIPLPPWSRGGKGCSLSIQNQGDSQLIKFVPHCPENRYKPCSSPEGGVLP